MHGKGQVKVLVDRTKKEFNIDFDSLSKGSHKKIYVECLRCGQILLRERRYIHQLHACPTHIIRDDGVKLKWCNSCTSFLTHQMFSTSNVRYDKLSSICKTCSQNVPSAKNRPSRRVTLEGWMKNFLSAKKSRCRKSGMECNIDFKYLINLWKKQNGKCYYSAVELDFGKNKLNSANLDRIDPSIGYIDGNVAWASKAVNMMKNQFSEEELYEFLGRASFTNIRLECKLDHKDARLPFRKRITDAGYDIFSISNVVINPGSTETIETGIRMAPPPGWYVTIEGRSSLYKAGIVPRRGVIDATYTGPILVMLYNSSNKPFEIKSGDRIAQAIIYKINHGDFVIVGNFSPEYNQRGDLGWGSSGGSSVDRV